jgi:hypothetical protein
MAQITLSFSGFHFKEAKTEKPEDFVETGYRFENVSRVFFRFRHYLFPLEALFLFSKPIVCAAIKLQTLQAYGIFSFVFEHYRLWLFCVTSCTAL